MLINPKNKEDLKKGTEYFEKLIKGNVPFELKRVNNKRSVDNNAYLHVCITLYAIEFGYTIEESKTYLKRICSFMVYEKNGQKFLRRTRDLDDKECCNFTNFIRNYSSKNGLYIPSPDEYLLKQYEIKKEIDKHKEYL